MLCKALLILLGLLLSTLSAAAQNMPVFSKDVLLPAGRFIVVIDDADSTILRLYHDSAFPS